MIFYSAFIAAAALCLTTSGLMVDSGNTAMASRARPIVALPLEDTELNMMFTNEATGALANAWTNFTSPVCASKILGITHANYFTV